MMDYLRGRAVAVTPGDRSHLTLEVNGVGYELQIPSQLARELARAGEGDCRIFTHLQLREDQLVLYGFGSAAERDLFRQLVGVTGVGNQLALAAIDALGARRLAEAIASEDTAAIARVPGIGPKTAERMALELKKQLSDWAPAHSERAEPEAVPNPAIREEVGLTLSALGYSNDEIEQAIAAVAANAEIAASTDADSWIRGAIAWLSERS